MKSEKVLEREIFAIIIVIVTIFLFLVLLPLGYSIGVANRNHTIVECGRATNEQDKVVYYDDDRIGYKVIKMVPVYKEVENKEKEKEK